MLSPSSVALLATLCAQSEAAESDPSEDAAYEYVHYNLDVLCPGQGAVAVRQRKAGKVTLKDMRESFSTGIDNTGNVCLWPAEEVMTHYILSRAADFQGKNICELGAGAGLCGLAMAHAIKTNSLLLTDGNAQVVETLDKALSFNRRLHADGSGLASAEVSTRLLVWDRTITPLEV